MDHTTGEGALDGELSKGHGGPVRTVLCLVEISFCNFVFVNLQNRFCIFFQSEFPRPKPRWLRIQPQNWSRNATNYATSRSLEEFRPLEQPPRVFVNLQTDFRLRFDHAVKWKLTWSRFFSLAFDIISISRRPEIWKGCKPVVRTVELIDCSSFSRLPSLYIFQHFNPLFRPSIITISISIPNLGSE